MKTSPTQAITTVKRPSMIKISKGRSKAADHVEDCIAFADFVASVPCRQEVHHTREKSGFENTKNKSQANKCLPVVDKSKPDHHNTPEESNGAEEDTWSNLTAEDRGRWLAEGVGYEEY